jgi:hypothetical protein
MTQYVGSEFVDPISGAVYGRILYLWSITILKIIGWRGERITVSKFFERELVVAIKL